MDESEALSSQIPISTVIQGRRRTRTTAETDIGAWGRTVGSGRAVAVVFDYPDGGVASVFPLERARSVREAGWADSLLMTVLVHSYPR